MSSTMQRLVVLAGIGAVTLTGCGSSSTTSSSTSSATATTSSTSVATTQASSGTTAEASSSATATPADRAWTDAELASVLKKVHVGGKGLTVASSGELSQLRSGLASNQMVQVMEKSTVTPAACGTATTKGAKDFSTAAKGQLAAGLTSGQHLVVLFDLPTSTAARNLVENNRATGKACTSYTLVSTQSGQKMTVKGTSKVLDVQAPSTDDATGQLSNVTVNGKASATSTVLATVGDVLVEVADPQGKANAAQLSQELEAVAKTVAAAR